MKLGAWLDRRTGLGPVARYVRDRRIPRGVSWLHTLGSATLTVFVLLIVTGMFLALNYSASISEAHASTTYIVNNIPLGSFVLGLHYWGASAMVILIGAHMLRVFFMGTYKFPREISWVIGVAIFCLVMLFAFTGYLLPWDNTAYFATRVGVNIVGSTPLIGGLIASLIRGGQDVGAATLTHFYAIHVIFLPAAVSALVAGHLFLVVRNGIAAPPQRLRSLPANQGAGGPGAMPTREINLEDQAAVPGESFYPRHVLMDLTVAFLVLLVLCGLALFFAIPDSGNANPANSSFAPRPAWYYLFFFQLLRYVPPPFEVIGTTVLPIAALTVFLLVPWLDRRPGRHPLDRPLVTAFGIAAVIVILGLTAVGAVSQ